MRSTILVGVIAALFSTAYTATAPAKNTTVVPVPPKGLTLPPNGQAISLVATYGSASSIADQWKAQDETLKLSWDVQSNSYSEVWSAF